MKIGFYGNANNYPFMLARAFRRAGHEVEFFVVSRRRLNRPEFRYADIKLPYPPWIHDIAGVLRFRWLFPFGRTFIYEVLNRCDFVFVNEEGAALTSALLVPHIAIITGSDLTVFADLRVSAKLIPKMTGLLAFDHFVRRILAKLLLDPLLVRPQRRGLASANFATYFPRGLIPDADVMLDVLGLGDDRRHFLHITDVDLINPAPPPANKIIRIFCPTRLTWKSEPDSDLTLLDYKGSDIMIRGLGMFFRKTGQQLDIHLVRKGRHVAETAALAASEGIASQITWHEEMTQREVLAACQDADIIIEQLANSSVGMAGLDAMAIGRPLIANGRPDIVEPLTGERSPICQARTSEEVCKQLERLASSPDERRHVGISSRRYVEKHFSSDAAAEIILDRLRSL